MRIFRESYAFKPTRRYGTPFRVWKVLALFRPLVLFIPTFIEEFWKHQVSTWCSSELENFTNENELVLSARMETMMEDA